MIDFHTHILPNMDDGSDSVQTSIDLLNILKNDGVKLVCLTSHFYPRNESIEDFLKRRQESFNKLNYKGLDLRLGAEVHYYRGISASEDIEKLCIENTNILLLELSFNSPINDNVIKDILNLKHKGFTVILAHIERYNINEKTLIELHNNGILLQCNTEAFEGYFNSRNTLKWLEKGLIDVIGSDAHNLKDRKPNYGKTMDLIYNKLGEDFYKKFIDKTYKIIEKK